MGEVMELLAEARHEMTIFNRPSKRTSLRMIEALTTAQAEIEALRARVAELEGVLADPNAVHANLLRGDISRPTVHQIIHIYSPAKVRDGLETYAIAALSGSQT